MTLVKIPGVSKRQKKIVILTIAQETALTDALPTAYAMMVLIAVGIDLRVEEV